MTGGFIKVYRSIQGHWLFTGKPFCELAAWIDLLLLAAWENHPDKRGQTQNRGEICTSQLVLAERWGWSRRTVERFLKRLQVDGMVLITTDRNKNTGGTRLTLLNFARYQGCASNGTSKCASKCASNLIGEPLENCASKGASKCASNGAQLRSKEEQPPPNGGAENQNATAKPPKAKANGGTVWRAWVDVNRAAGRQDPAAVGPDLKAGKELAKILPADDVQKILTAYLDDQDPFLVKQGHALRLLPGRVNGYLNGTADPIEAARQKALRGEL